MSMLPKYNQKRSRSPSIFLLSIVLLVLLVILSGFAVFAYNNKATQTQKPTTTSKATQTHKPTNASTSTQLGSSFSFTAAGDYGQTNYTTANLNYIAKSGVSFHLGLGDFNYDANVSADGWSSYAKSHLPANFSFEIVAGGHDTEIDTLAAELPDHIGHISGTYGKEYYFDYPPGTPLARFILVSPSGVLSGYNYNKGSSHYNWVAQKIEAARDAKIPWVIVGMHQYCFVIDSKSCAGQDLLDLLISKKVDLLLQAQKHNYQASKQLALNRTTCPTLPITSYNDNCVVNDSTNLTKGAGSVIIVTGTGGTSPLLSINTSDPKKGYFRSWMGANVNQTWGVSKLTVSAVQLTMQFIGISGGTFTDNFTIHA